MKIRIAMFVVVLLIVGLGTACFDVAVQPTVASQFAVEQVQDSDAAGTTLRSYDAVQRAVPAIGLGVVTASAVLLFGDRILSRVRSFSAPAVEPVRGEIAHEKSF